MFKELKGQNIDTINDDNIRKNSNQRNFSKTMHESIA
jgi:hypothetical protein